MAEIKNWTLEFAEAFRRLSDLFAFLGESYPLKLQEVEELYPVFIPKSLALKIKQQGLQGPLARQFIPSLEELSAGGMKDPIGDERFNPAPRIIHRYQNRVLFTPTSVCPVHCRYCFRKNELNQQENAFKGEFQQSLNYLMAHPEITEVILTGGDPLTLSNEKLQAQLESLRSVPHIKDVRFHTRFPVILPGRIDDGFCEVMKKAADEFRTVTIVIHANHACELSADVKAALKRLQQLPLQLLSQSVLLKGINDSEKDLQDLIETLIDHQVRPYYLHHPDRVKGAMHFYLSLEEGRTLYAGLRKKVPGWALPQYVIDIPGGEGKVSAFNPETLSFSGRLLNQHGLTVEVKEPDSFVQDP